ncbi:MAG: sigma-54-dependent Fis family transcriptional regulator [Deltaproteobacteria bacterium]|nr:MAG: sigma-54-dependent Fis family transcriptional regulator [Deltaproteobacteria bacterium]
MAETILIVDDEKNIIKSLTTGLRLEGFSVISAETGEKALDIAAGGQIDLVLLDVRLSGIDGIETLTRLRARFPDLPVVMMSGHGTIRTAVTATQKGAIDFLEKPIAMEKLLLTIRNALALKRLADENDTLRRQIDRKHVLVGESPPMRELKARIAQIAPTNGRVLITGENGTGKELIARAIHAQSRRRDKPFIMLNCAAVPRELIESELFGHEKGAFTHAIRTRKGKFEQADGGTLFLDEIGDMPLDMQAKLLRVLQEGEFERVGGNRLISVDVRIIAATNKDLAVMIREGTFREDLFFRLNVIPFRAPPLRERKADIPRLVEHFVGIICEENGKRPKTITAEALSLLEAYDYPGNIRELRNTVERLVILVPSETITHHDVMALFEPAREPRPRAAAGASLREQLQRAERSIIEEALRRNDWNVSSTARELQIERSHLYKKMRQLEITRG